MQQDLSMRGIDLLQWGDRAHHLPRDAVFERISTYVGVRCLLCRDQLVVMHPNAKPAKKERA